MSVQYVYSLYVALCVCVWTWVGKRGSVWRLVGAMERSEFTVLKETLSQSLCFGSVAAEALAWPQQLEQSVVGVVRILHNLTGSGSAPPGVQVLQGGECGSSSAFGRTHYSLQSPPILRGAVAKPGSYVSRQDALYSSRVERLKDPQGDSESLQLSEVVKALPCLSHQSVCVWRPCQILCDVDSQVFVAAHPLHSSPINPQWCVRQLLCSSKVGDGCGSEGRAGRPPIRRSVVRSPAAPGHMSMCPWARHLTPNCSRRHSHRCVNEYLDYILMGKVGTLAASAISVWMCVWMGECWHVV